MRPVLIIMMLLLIPGAMAIGISPAQVSLSPDDTAFTFRAISDSPVSVRVEGDLAQHITLEKTVVQPGEEIRGTISLPGDVTPGTHQQYIVVSSAASEGGTIGAAAEAAGSLLIKIPYPEEYLEADWAVTSDGDVALITVTVENLGSRPTIPRITVAIDGKTLPVEAGMVAPGEFGKSEARHTVTAPGEYEAILEILYSDRRITEARTHAFGSPRLAISSLTYNDESGEIKPVDITGTTGWNRQLNLTLELYLDNSTTPALTESFVTADAFAHRAYLTPGYAPSTVKAVLRSGDAQTTATVRTGEAGIAPGRSFWPTALFIVAMLVVVIIIWRFMRKPQE